MKNLIFSIFFFSAMFFASLAPHKAWADPSLYTVTGISVDATDKDATQARLKAISQAQVQAFATVVRRLGADPSQERFKSFPAKEIGRLMASLSVEEEKTAPGRYIGKLTISFLPSEMKAFLERSQVSIAEGRGPLLLIVPVWLENESSPQIWQDTPWKQAWQTLQGQASSYLPLVVLKGDDADRKILNDPSKNLNDTDVLNRLKNLYGATYLLVAYGSPQGPNAVHMKISGNTQIGQVLFDKTYGAECSPSPTCSLKEAARVATARFQTALLEKVRLKEKLQQEHSEPVSKFFEVKGVVSFDNPDDFIALRADILSVLGIEGLDVQAIAAHSAAIVLKLNTAPEQVRQHLRDSGWSVQEEENAVWSLSRSE